MIVNHNDASNKENKIVIEKPDIVQDDKFALEIIKVKTLFQILLRYQIQP